MSMGNQAAWWSMVALLAAGCGFAPKAASPPASTTLPSAAAPPPSVKTPSPTISPSPTPARTSCYPAWERHDLVQAASAHLPVPTTTVWSNLGNGPRIDATNLAKWLGKPSHTALTPQSLLQGWSLPSPSRATGSLGVLALMPNGNGPVMFGRTGSNLVLAEHRPTSDQTALLKRWGMANAQNSKSQHPFTLLIWVPPAAHADTLSKALRYVIGQVKSGQTLPVSVSLLRAGSNPARYQSYAGPIAIPSLLLPRTACAPRSTGWVMGVDHGLILPQKAPFALDANGIRLGFAPRAVIVDNNHAGYDVVQWFWEPAIRMPTGIG